MSTHPHDPTRLDDGFFGFGAPPARHDESMVDVLGRVAEVAADLQGSPGATSPATAPFSDLSTSATSPTGEVDVAVRETVVTSLRLDPHWLRTADVLDVEQLVRDTVNKALADFREQAVEQVMSGATGGDDLASRIAALQTDMHEAFRNDLARAVAPGEALVRRLGGLS